jgi:hypothetical protein
MTPVRQPAAISLDVGHDGCQHGQYQRDHANFQAPHGP